ncbi:MAG: ATP-binding cassette domain-containing protein [Lachnospiraceae bacterium]|nr:ATP-binding cassette domain-containing protein [Lachnospiraceae bacterium]
MRCIAVINANVNNLKNVSIQIPLDRYVVFVGKSGSGKSTLAVNVVMSGYMKKLQNVTVPLEPVLFKQKAFIPNSDQTIAGFLGISSDSIGKYIENNKKIKKEKKMLLTELLQILELERICTGDLIRELNLTKYNKLRFIKMLLKTEAELLIVDELGAGLSINEARKIAKCFRRLVDFGYSILSVEHAVPIIEQSDYVIELGPDAGEYGGEVTFEGDTSEYKKSKSWKEMINLLKETASIHNKLSKGINIGDINYHGFKNLDLTIPFSGIVTICGPSGGGKSSLLDIIYRACDKSASAWKNREGIDGAIDGKNNLRRPYMIDQAPIGNNAMSTPATYTSIMESLRNIYLNKAIEEQLKFDKSDFSFNSSGQCQKCKGRGSFEVKIDDEQIYEVCDACNGKRYNENTLSVKESDMSIGDVLSSSCQELYKIYSKDSKKRILTEKIDFINKIGLSYLRLGQPSGSLSGGESQRIKITKELSKKLGDRCLFILDSPAKGLHMMDLPCVMESLQKLIEKNNSVVIAENNPYFVYMSDWIIYLQDGKIMYEGLPENCPKKLLNGLMGGKLVES